MQPWLTKQKSHEIFRSTASTVNIPARWNPRAKQQQRVALADFSAAPWQGFEKSANAAPTTPPCFSRRLRSSLLHWADCLRRYAPPPCSSPFHRANMKKQPPTTQNRAIGGCFIFDQALATPVSRAAFATAFATASATRGSNAPGMMFSSLRSASVMRSAMA